VLVSHLHPLDVYNERRRGDVDEIIVLVENRPIYSVLPDQIVFVRVCFDVHAIQVAAAISCVQEVNVTIGEFEGVASDNSGLVRVISAGLLKVRVELEMRRGNKVEPRVRQPDKLELLAIESREVRVILHRRIWRSVAAALLHTSNTARASILTGGIARRTIAALGITEWCSSRYIVVVVTICMATLPTKDLGVIISNRKTHKERSKEEEA